MKNGILADNVEQEFCRRGYPDEKGLEHEARRSMT